MRSVLLLLMIWLPGCTTATIFTGSAKIEGGAPACAAKCSSWGMEMSGMIAMGDYSEACVCHVPGKAVSQADVAATAAGAAGVTMQLQRDQQAQARAIR
ncbi:hypothetical protein [Polyangium aurulentum]|uniref:hypothetical protein n=1 Tax=Polyangium aurulentum TaxID=2567896 RepID=UPI0010AE3A4E|nr:hypothetical protein [Polyangium aurulentum]UQA59938.1 hypothetical protein E8A73_005450 [Polyangium aurulentum]